MLPAIRRSGVKTVDHCHRQMVQQFTVTSPLKVQRQQQLKPQFDVKMKKCCLLNGGRLTTYFCLPLFAVDNMPSNLVHFPTNCNVAFVVCV